jgi:homoserine O-acetyltransferase/O-succinyltransferase
MRLSGLLLQAVIGITLLPSFVSAADYPAPKQADWVARDFRFHTGEVMPELRLHYTTIGDPKGEPVLILHGTGGAGGSFLNAAFAGELFGAGQPLDASKYYLILPDAIGAGKSMRPSEGLRTKFPQYNYDDMVQAQHRLVTEGLGIKHLRLVMGNSMGGMQSWIWGETYPDAMDALLPMASQPVQMLARNWMLRRLLVETIRNDPEWMNGDYKTQPHSLRLAAVFFSTATSGGTRGYYALAPTHDKADKLVEQRLAAPPPADANDFIYQWQSSADYNPEPGLERIQAHLLAINSADDERNPPELGIMEPLMKRIKNGQLYLIPASNETRGHGTTGMAKLWKAELVKLLQAAPHKTM